MCGGSANDTFPCTYYISVHAFLASQFTIYASSSMGVRNLVAWQPQTDTLEPQEVHLYRFDYEAYVVIGVFFLFWGFVFWFGLVWFVA